MAEPRRKQEPKVKREIAIKVEIPTHPRDRGRWSAGAHYTIQIVEPGLVKVFAPCGADYGHIKLDDLKEAVLGLQPTAEERAELGL